jgi:hypothetical protein
MWPSTNNIIKGKVMASLSLNYGESSKFVFARGSFVHQKWTNYSLTNLLSGLCKFVWIIDPFVIRSSPHPEFQDVTLPSKCCELKNVPNSLSFCCFHLRIKSWVYQRVWGASHWFCNSSLEEKLSFAINFYNSKLSFATILIIFNYKNQLHLQQFFF